MINNEGELTTAITDVCKNYEPDKIKPTKVISAKTGTIYECENYKLTEEKIPEMIDSKSKGCLFCYNWQTAKEGYVNRK